MTDCENRKKGCGGCTLLGEDYAAQLARKQQMAQAALGRFGPVEPILQNPEPLHYRAKGISTFAAGPGGQLVSGFYAAGSHRVLPTAGCLLHHPQIDASIAAVLQAARACRYTPYDEDRDTGLLRHVLVRRSSLGQVLVVLVTAQRELPGARSFAALLRKNAPWVTSLVQNYNPRATSAVLGAQNHVLFGSGIIIDELLGLRFGISAGSFYQVNPAQTPALYQTALDFAALTGAENVVDAYCGTGTIGLCAARSARRVTGVELSAPAVENARGNARHNHLPNAGFLCADATRWLAQQAAQNRRADVIFMDPPRAGSTPEFLSAAAAMGPARIVYISCNVETQARDIALLTRLGYRMVKARPVDMFSQTPHLETVVLMSKVQK